MSAPDPAVASKSAVDAAIDGAGVTPYACLVVLLCILAGVTEGFDTSSGAFAAPLIAQSWGVDSDVLAWALTASGVGMILGGALLAPLGDHWGRRPAIVLNLMIAGVFAMLGGQADGPVDLTIYRFLCGLGVGGVFPNIIALGIEFLPARHKAFGGVLISCSLSIGSTISGFIAGHVGAIYGWPAIFLFSGGSTVAVAGLCLLLLPESPQVLASRPGADARLLRVMRRVAADFDPGSPAPGPAARRGAGAPLRQLFGPGLAGATLLLWLIFFLNMCMTYFFLNWLPTVLSERGVPVSQATQVSAMFTMGGVVMSVGLALAQRWIRSAAALLACYAIGSASVLALGMATVGGAPLFLLVFAAGGGVMGAQFILNVFTGRFYPVEARATGLGMAGAVGRVGGVATSLAGGFLLASNVTSLEIFRGLAAPGLIAAAAVLVLWLAPGFAGGRRAVAS